MANRVGQQFGNYRLIQLLGSGGFAEVYLAEHRQLGMKAAIKILYAHLERSEISSFRQEARMIADLKHPHIVRVLDFDVQNGTPFLVLDYASKGSLRALHSKGNKLPLDLVVTYVQQIASALQHAHEHKLIHRDVKPENVLIGEDGHLLLSDFGIATIAHSTSSMATTATVGTLAYMAPEQIQGKPRPASDQYALAVTVYQWLTGALPFVGSSAEIIAQHLGTPPPPLREIRPNLPAEVERVVLKALAKTPQERFENVLLFVEALEKASLLPNESYYPQNVTLAMRICYHEWSENSLGEPKDMSPDDAKMHTSAQKTTGFKRPFANGAIYWSERGGAQPIWRDFADIHERLGGSEGILGFPLTPELPAAPSPLGTKGAFQRFEGQWNYPEDVDTDPIKHCGASLYFSKLYGAHPTYGGIGICYERQWGTGGALGFPTSDEIDAGPSPHGTTGKCQHFEGGAIYWSWSTNAHGLRGDIAQLYESLDGATGRLGFPLSGKKPADPSPQGTTGTFQKFEGGLADGFPEGETWDFSKGVSVYSSKYGAYPVWGGIQICYEQLGKTSGILGFPTSLEMEAAKSPQGTAGWYQYFEGGVIFWCEHYGGVPVTGSLLIPYNEFSGTEGQFGFPKSPERFVEQQTQMILQEFEGGLICVYQVGTQDQNHAHQ